ncbi:MAG: hypothetical protein ABIG44_18875, partial [Planctomycetota bacterium]
MADVNHDSQVESSAAPLLPVLHVADAHVLARLGRMLRHVTLAQNAEGLRVILLTNDSAAVADLDGTPVECHWTPHICGWLAWRRPRLLLESLYPRPQIVHLWGASCMRSVGEPALHAGIPVLAHALSTHDLARFARYGDQPHLYLAAGCNGLA